MLRGALLATGLGVLAAAIVTAGSATAPPASLNVRVFADTGVKLTDVLWTGRFVYVENTANALWAAGPKGAPVQKFASMPRKTEETRCRLSPGAHGFPPGDIYCHAFDTTGRFGFDLIAATGRSGKSGPARGTVYAISPGAHTRLVADFYAAGGADEVLVAPKSFGSAAGWAILTIDAGSTGEVFAVDPGGLMRRIATLPDGPNPIVAIVPSGAPSGHVAAGLYLTDTSSRKVFFADATQFARYAGDLIVGTELKGQLWLVRPRGNGFVTRLLRTNLPAAKYNLEGATYISG